MASMRESMQKAHEAASDHHAAMAKSHEALAERYSGMCKADGSAESKMYQSIADEHQTMAKNHQAASEFHGQCADECAKAVEDSLNKIRPDSISSVARLDAPSESFGIRAYPRAGAPAVAAIDKANIPLQFRHLIASDPDDI